MSTMSRVTSFQNYEHRVTCPISSVNSPPKLCTRFQNSTVSMVIPHTKPCTWGHMSTVIPLLRPCNWCHTSTVSRESPLPRPYTCVTCLHSPVSSPSSPFTWCHMSTGSRMTPSKYLHLGHMSRISLVTPLQDSVSGVTFSVSRVNSLLNTAHGITHPLLQADRTSP